jgi:hypothetical protein
MFLNSFIIFGLKIIGLETPYNNLESLCIIKLDYVSAYC